MAGGYDSWGFTPKTWYTYDEAIEYMKYKDTQPTGRPVSWKDRNGNHISIGYN